RKFINGELRTHKDGQAFIQSVEGVHVSEKTVRNYLKLEGCKTYCSQKKPGLTDDQKKLHYKFAKAHLHWTVDDWKN
ncbi:hypothetical protein BGZ46_003518, partial [Entomortierella lignicola]